MNTAAESAYESERQSYTTSLASSITNYKFLNGRRYHAYKEGSYIIPNDEKESDRLDIQHKMIEVAMGGKIFFSPIKDPKRILDIGTGTGIWAMEVGDIFPNADVLGIDLSPIQPRWVPPNVHFEIDDIEDPWTYANKFDFVFSRTMANAIKDWPGLVKQCFEFTRPGGYAEFVDYDLLYTSPDGSLKEENPLWIYNRMFLKLCDDTGLEARPGVFLEKWVKDVGFEDVKVWKLPLPVGTWASDKRLVCYTFLYFLSHSLASNLLSLHCSKLISILERSRCMESSASR